MSSKHQTRPDGPQRWPNEKQARAGGPHERLGGPARGAGGPASEAVAYLAPRELNERLEEEIGRACRHGTSLGCLLIRIEDFQRIADTHGPELAEHALEHACGALDAELRCFDRVGRPVDGELAVVLPGADPAAGEAVARRTLARLRSIKIEVGRVRQPLTMSVGIATWRSPWTSGRLIEEARAAANGVGRRTREAAGLAEARRRATGPKET